jgi:hypothetical protein
MKKYMVTLRTAYGTFTIDDVFSNSEKEAEETAYQMAIESFEDYKLDEIHEYEL